MTLPQLLMFDRDRRNEVLDRRRERVRRAALEVRRLKRSTRAGADDAQSRSICASPKVRAEMAPNPSESAAVIGRRVDRALGVARRVRLTCDPSTAASCRLALARWPVSPTRQEQTGLAPPWDRSYWISRSPAVRTGVTPLAEACLRLVELEVHVRRAGRLLDPAPGQVQEVVVTGRPRGRRRR